MSKIVITTATINTIVNTMAKETIWLDLIFLLNVRNPVIGKLEVVCHGYRVKYQKW